MENLSIQTNQNIELDYKIAGIGDRILAFIFDFLIFLALYILVVIFDSTFNTYIRYDFYFSLFFSIIFFTYHPLCEILMNGQSFGKKIMKTQVRKTDGSAPSIGEYVLRWLLSLVDVSLSSGTVAIISILINGKGQRVGDITAGTTVIKLQDKVELKDTMWHEIEDDYKTQIPEVTSLSQEDINLVKEIVDVYNDNVEIPDSIAVMIIKAKQAFEYKMGIQSNMKPITFMRTILKDHSNEHKLIY